MEHAVDRKDILLDSLKLDELGIEIGPSHSPLAPKREGYNVHVLDHLSREGLIEKYRPHGINVELIEEVDFVWDGRSYAELVGARGSYSWILASHVIEHAPDLVGFLAQCEEILTKDGVLSLAIPDKRNCFDHFRPISSLASVVDASLAPASVHTPGSVAEYFLNVSSKGGLIAWGPAQQGDSALIHTLDDAQRGMATALAGTYLDIHRWCFVPSSFRLMMKDLYDLGLTNLKEVKFNAGEGIEFYMQLSRQGDGFHADRLAVLQDILVECSVGTH